jgi:hypothetical protein
VPPTPDDTTQPPGLQSRAAFYNSGFNGEFCDTGYRSAVAFLNLSGLAALDVRLGRPGSDPPGRPFCCYSSGRTFLLAAQNFPRDDDVLPVHLLVPAESAYPSNGSASLSIVV